MRVRGRAGAIVPSLVFTAFALGAPGCKESAMPNDTTKQAVSRCADPRDVLERARRAAEGPGADIGWDLSPILPGVWPPAGPPVAVLFAYVRTPLPTSTERWQVRSPFLRVDVPLTDASAAPSVTRLDARALSPAESGRTPRATPEAMEAAAAALLGALCAGAPPAPADEQRLRAAYREWAFEHGALADELRRLCPAFFSWLDTGE